MKLDLGFGNTPCIRKAFLETYHGDMIVFTANGLDKMDYPDRHGDPELIEITRNVIKRQLNIEKKHIFLTNGATGAVTIALRAFGQKGFQYCYTRAAPWYLRYPSMIEASGLIHMDENDGIIDPIDSVLLLDVPSNPKGIVCGIDNSITASMVLDAATVLDAVYLNRVYTSGFIPVITHDVLAGSYSKLLGLNGLRVGWVGTNDDLLAERFKGLITAEYCGISMASTEILKNALFNFDWDTFETIAKRNLNYNREEWSKLERFFDGQSVNSNGMFFYSKIDAKCRKLLQKAGISWTKGSDLGTDDRWGRFNLGQDVDLVRKAVNAMIREDLRPKKTTD